MESKVNAYLYSTQEKSIKQGVLRMGENKCELQQTFAPHMCQKPHLVQLLLYPNRTRSVTELDARCSDSLYGSHLLAVLSLYWDPPYLPSSVFIEIPRTCRPQSLLRSTLTSRPKSLSRSPVHAVLSLYWDPSYLPSPQSVLRSPSLAVPTVCNAIALTCRPHSLYCDRPHLPSPHSVLRSPSLAVLTVCNAIALTCRPHSLYLDKMG